jgi:hypothetical protein
MVTEMKIPPASVEPVEKRIGPDGCRSAQHYHSTRESMGRMSNMKAKSKSKARLALEALRREYPNATKEELADLTLKMVMEDEELKRSVVEDVFHMICDDLYNEAAREGREIPTGLRRPS